mgnify:CR=1 FL=1
MEHGVKAMSWLAECGGRLDFIYKGHISPYKGHNFSDDGQNKIVTLSSEVFI